MPSALIDSHVHMDDPQFDADRAGVFARAWAVGVTRIVNVGYNAQTWESTLGLCTEPAAGEPTVYACLGLHPNDANDWDDTITPTLRRLLAHPRAVAVGETGLDYYRDSAPAERQRKAFIAQLALAREAGKPVVIHHREAQDDLLAILQEDVAVHGPVRGVLHAFNGDPVFAQSLLDLGLHLGLGGPVTFKNAAELHAAVRIAPLERVVIETDSPYLAPHPHRSKRNEPAYVALVCARIAELRGCAADEIAAITTANAERLFIPDKARVV